MRNQRNEETGRETRSNLPMLGREKEMASEEFEEESYLLMYQGSKHATNSNREEERWPRPVPYSFALLSLSLFLSYLPPELDVAIETKAESTNREEPAWKRTSLGVRMDGWYGLTGRLHGSDEHRDVRPRERWLRSPAVRSTGGVVKEEMVDCLFCCSHICLWIQNLCQLN